MHFQSTAILLFSRTATAEVEMKSFGAGAAGSRITEALIARTELTLKKTRLPVFRSDESSQVGHTFGERLANAMARVYNAGFKRLLVVGNDCPSVSAAHLIAAARQLGAGRNVVGPDRRGGVWLIGLQRKDFDATVFAALPWESHELYGALSDPLPDRVEANSFSDLNTFEDLRQNWFFLRRRISELFDLLLLPQKAFCPPGPQPKPVAFMRRLGRAPPC